MSDFSIRGTISADSTRFRNELRRSQAALAGARGDMAKTAVSAKALEFQQRRLNDALRDQRRALQGLTLDYVAVRRAMLTLAIRSAVTGFAALTAAAGGLAVGLGAVADQAGLASAALGTGFVSGLGAGAQALFTLKLGLDGVGKALATTGTEHEKALDKLTRPQRRLVGQLKELREAYRDLQLVAAEGLTGGLTRGLARGQGIFGPLREAIYDTALAVGYLAEQAGALVGSKSFGRDFEKLGRRNAETIMDIGDAALFAVDGLRHWLRVADPLIGHMTEGVKDLAQSYRDWMREARRSGEAAVWVREMGQAWDRTTSIIGRSGRIAISVMRAMHPVSERLWTDFNRLVKKADEWAKSDAGQRKMRRAFEDLEPVTRAMGDALADTVASMARLSTVGAPNATRIFEGWGDRVVPLLEALATNLNKFILPAILDVGSALIDLAEDAMPALTAISELTGDVLGIVADGLRAVHGLVEPLDGIGGGMAVLAIGAGVLASWAAFHRRIDLTILKLRSMLALAPRGLVTWGDVARGHGPGATGAGTPAMSPAYAFGGGRTTPRLAGGAGPQPSYREGRTILSPEIPGLGKNHGWRAGGFMVPPAPWFIGQHGHGRYPRTTMFGFGGPIGASKFGSGALSRRPRLTDIGIVGGRLVDLGEWRTANQSRLWGSTNVPHVPLLPSRPSIRVTPGDPLTGRTGGGTRFQRDGALWGGREVRGGPGRFALVGAAMRNSMAGLRESVSRGIESGAKAASPRVRAVMGGAFGMAAISGIISGLASNEKRLRDRFADALSGATFGAAPSAAESRDQLVSKVGAMVRSGRGRNIKTEGILEDVRINFEGVDLRDPKKLRDLELHLKALRDAGNITAEQFKALRAQIRRTADQAQAMASLKGSPLDGLIPKGSVKDGVRSLDLLEGKFREIRGSTAKSITGAREHVKRSMALIRKYTKEGSDGAKAATARAFGEVAGSIRRGMKAGVIDVEKGWREIERLMARAYKQYGFTDKQANREARNRGEGRYDGGKDEGTHDISNARGGLNRVGSQKAGLDKRRVSMVVGEGEDIAVLTRHQRKVVDERLSDMGGLPGLFRNVRTPHGHSAEPRFARGGVVRGDTDYSPAMHRALTRMALATRTPIFVQSGGRTRAEQAALFARYGPGRAARPGQSNHERGTAADITPGRGRFGGVAGKFGLGFPLGHEPWHIELLNAAMAGDAQAVVELRRVKATRSKGMIGDLAQQVLDRIRSAAQHKLEEDLTSSGFGVNIAGSTSAGGSGKGLMKRIARDRGWNFAHWWELDRRETSHGRNLVNPTSTARLRGQFLDINYGKYGPGSDPAQNPSMAEQIHAMARYIAERYGNPTRALAHHDRHNWYDQGGLVAAATGLMSVARPGLDGSAPDTDTSDAITDGSRSRRRRRRRRRRRKVRWVSGPSRPNLSKIKGRRNRNRRPKVPKRVLRHGLDQALKAQPHLKVDLPNFDSQFEDPIQALGQAITNLTGIHGLTEEQPTVSLYDSEAHADLTNYLRRHPEALRGAKNVDEFVEKYGDELEVVNHDGMTVQGKFVRGIKHRAGELGQLLMQHTGDPAGQGKGGMRGLLERYLGAVDGPDSWQAKLWVSRALALNEYRALRRIWRGRKKARDIDMRRYRKLLRRSTSWRERVADNEAKVEALQDYKREIRQAASTVKGGRLTSEAKRNLAWADRQIDELNDSTKQLKKTKPGPITRRPRRRKGESSKAYRRRLNRWRENRDERQKDIRSTRREIKGHTAVLQWINGSVHKWNDTEGEVGRYRELLDSRHEQIQTLARTAGQITRVERPANELEVAQLISELNDWRGTSIPSPRVNRADSAAADRAAREAEIKQLLEQQNEQLRMQMTHMRAQFDAMSGFQPLLAGRQVGSFAHGGVIPETGLALVHKGEYVVPNPEGPFRNGQNAPQLVQAGPGGETVIRLEGDLAAIVRLIEARQGAKSMQVSQQLGRRARMIRAAPGG